MKREYLLTWLCSTLVAAAAMMSVADRASAAENAAPGGSDAKAAEAPKPEAVDKKAEPAPVKAEPATGQKKAEGKKSYRRLPPYYTQLVSDEQKEKIYAIQAEYSERIDSLRAQLSALEKQRDAKVAAVLTPEQQKQLEDVKAAAKAGRDGKKTSKTKKSAPPATTKPADKPAEKTGETAPAK